MAGAPNAPVWPGPAEEARMSCRVNAIVAGLAVIAATPISAQERTGAPVTTAAFATAGAALGLAAAAWLAPAGSTACPTLPGSRCDSSNPVIPLVAASVVGSTVGAMVGRRLSGGHQSLGRSALGAAMGLVVGGMIASQLHTDQTVPIGITIAVPQGLLSTLAGW